MGRLVGESRTNMTIWRLAPPTARKGLARTKFVLVVWDFAERKNHQKFDEISGVNGTSLYGYVLFCKYSSSTPGISKSENFSGKPLISP